MNFVELLLVGFAIDYLRAYHGSNTSANKNVHACRSIWQVYYLAASEANTAQVAREYEAMQ